MALDPNYMAPTPDYAGPTTQAQSSGNPVELGQYIGTVTDRAYKDWQNQRDMMDWAKAQFQKNQGVSDQVVGRALDTSKKFSDWSQADRDLYEGTYVPAMKEQMDFARGYTTPERMAANRAGAMSQQNIAFDANADAAKRQLSSIGVDPSSGRFAGLDAGLAAARAKNAAAAGTMSDRQTEMLGQQYLANAIATGQVLPGQVVNEAGAGMAAGNQAVNTGLATTASGSATMGTPLQWNAQGNDMIKQWMPATVASSMSGVNQNEANARINLEQQKIDMQKSSGVGAAIGAGAGLLGGVGKLAGGLGSMGLNFGGGAAAPDPSLGMGSVPSGGTDTGSWATARRGGMIPKFAKGGTMHDLLGMAGSAAGMLIPIPIVGPMIGKAAGHALGDVIEGNPGNIDDDLKSDATFGMADGGGGSGILGGVGKLFGMGRQGAQPDGTIVDNWGGAGTDAASWGGEGIDMAGSGFMFQEGGDVDSMSNMVPPEASPSGGAETDDVHALLNEGEFVVPKDVASWLGEKFLQNMINKARTEAAGPKAEPEQAAAPQAMAMAPPSFASEGARAGA
jgi:hypothetical protein